MRSTLRSGVDGVPGGGVVFGDAAWVRSPAPVATVDMGYLSNRSDAALMATATFRQDVATGVRDGVEAYLPGDHREARCHPRVAQRPFGFAGRGIARPRVGSAAGDQRIPVGPVIAWLAAIGVVGLLLLFRDAVARVLVVLIALVVRLAAGVMWPATSGHPAAAATPARENRRTT